MDALIRQAQALGVSLDSIRACIQAEIRAAQSEALKAAARAPTVPGSQVWIEGFPEPNSRVMVRNMFGKTVLLEYNTQDTVHMIKMRLSAKDAALANPAYIKLIYNARELDDGLPLPNDARDNGVVLVYRPRESNPFEVDVDSGRRRSPVRHKRSPIRRKRSPIRRKRSPIRRRRSGLRRR